MNAPPRAPEAGDRLDRPPDPAAYFRFAPNFGRRFAVFVDTEEEFDWTKPPSREARSTRSIDALPIIQRRLREAGIEPTYLVDHPIASDARSVATLREFLETGDCQIGTQLHPWVNPPFTEELGQANSYPGNLPLAAERAKLGRLTDLIARAFGRRPTIYRAGRYGVGPNSARLLVEAGYKMDVSVRALFDYRHQKGPDFSAFEPRPYFLREGALLEVPLTAAYVGALHHHGPRLFPRAGNIPHLRGLLARTGLLGRVALTPEGMPLDQVIAAIDRLLDDGLQLFSLSFHSPSLEPGHTPYVRSRADLDLFYAWWDGVLGHFARRGVTAVSAGGILAAAGAALANGGPAPLSAAQAHSAGL